jgi:hypothetical protein
LTWIGVQPRVSAADLLITEQGLPGDPPEVEEEAERKGLPDIVIHDGDTWCLLIESKIQAVAAKAIPVDTVGALAKEYVLRDGIGALADLRSVLLSGFARLRQRELRMITELAQHEASLFALGPIPQGPLLQAARQDGQEETRHAPVRHVLPHAPWLQSTGARIGEHRSGARRRGNCFGCGHVVWLTVSHERGNIMGTGNRRCKQNPENG